MKGGGSACVGAADGEEPESVAEAGNNHAIDIGYLQKIAGFKSIFIRFCAAAGVGATDCIAPWPAPLACEGLYQLPALKPWLWPALPAIQ